MKKKKDFRVFVGIPAYNAQKTIGDVIERTKELGIIYKILVVDDCSKDQTKKVVRRYKDVLLLENEVNMGYGGSQKIIFKKFFDISKNPDDIIIMLHSDGQTLPEEIPLFVEEFLDKSVDIVLGSRALGDMQKGKMPVYRIIGDKILTIIQNFCFGMNITTYASGYRGFRRRVLSRVQFNDLRNRHSFDTEILMRCNEANPKMMEIPVTTVYDRENLSNYSMITYSFTILSDAVKYKLKKIFKFSNADVHENNIKGYWKKSKHDWLAARKKGNIFERIFFNLKGNFILSKVDYRDKIVLDCGCGNGMYTFDLSKNSKMVVGLDISTWALKKANKIKNKENVFFLAGDSAKLPFKDNTFDVIVNTAVFQYYQSPSDMVNEIYRVVKPNGIVLSEVPYKYGLYNLKSIIKHLTSKKDFAKEPINRCYSQKEFKDIFSSFKPLKVYNFYNFLLFGIFKK